jgi:predicted PurR-regulated permease PerM
VEGVLSRLYEAKWAILGVGLISLLLWIAWPFLSVIIFAIFFYYVTRPIKRRLRPYIKNDTLLVLACMFLLTMPLLLILGYTLLLAIGQFYTLAQHITPLRPTYLENISELIYGAQSTLTQNIHGGNLGTVISEWYLRLKDYQSSIAGIRGILVSMGQTFIDIVFQLLLMLFIAFYLLRDDQRLKSWACATFPGLVAERSGMWVRYGEAVDSDLESIFFGNILSVVIFAIIAAAVYSLFNLFAPDPTFIIPYPVLLGVLLGIAAFLPLMGPWLVDIPILLFVLAKTLMAGTFFPNAGYYVLMAAGIFIFVETLPGYVLRPFVSHGRVNVGLLMFAYILGPIVFGIAGLFIAVILLTMLTHYFRVIIPEITKPS